MPEDEADLAYFLAHLPPDIPVTVDRARLEPDRARRRHRGRRDPARARLQRRHGRAGIRVRAGAAVPGRAGRAGRAGGGDRGACVHARHSGRDRRRAAHERRRLRRRDQGRADRGARRRSARQRTRYTNADMHFSYRHCGAPEDVIFTQALFEGTPGDRRRSPPRWTRSRECARRRSRSRAAPAARPSRTRLAHKAWELIDAAGCRGLTVGGAQVSELHCNFLINLGSATAADIEALGETVRRRVKDKSGIELEWEIKRIGVRPTNFVTCGEVHYRQIREFYSGPPA